MLTGFLSQNIFDILAIQSRITSCPILAQEKLFHCRKVCQILTNKDTNQSHFLLRWFFNYLHIMWKSCLEVKLVLSFVTFFRLISFLQITWTWLITLVAKTLFFSIEEKTGLRWFKSCRLIVLLSDDIQKEMSLSVEKILNGKLIIKGDIGVSQAWDLSKNYTTRFPGQKFYTLKVRKYAWCRNAIISVREPVKYYLADFFR